MPEGMAQAHIYLIERGKVDQKMLVRAFRSHPPIEYIHLPRQKNPLKLIVVPQTEIVKRMSAIIGQVLPFLSQEHQQQVATAMERAKQVEAAQPLFYRLNLLTSPAGHHV